MRRFRSSSCTIAFVIATLLVFGTAVAGSSDDGSITANAGFGFGYAIGQYGSILKFDENGHVVMSRQVPGLGRLVDVISSALSADGKYLYLGCQYRAIIRVNSDNLEVEGDWKAGWLAGLPALPQGVTHGTVRIISPMPQLLFVLDAAYNWTEDNPNRITAPFMNCSFVFDISSKTVRRLPETRLAGQQRTRISPDGRRMLIVDLPMKLIDVPTGRVMWTAHTNEVRTFVPRNPGETIFHGLDVNWEEGFVDIWQSRNDEKNNIVVERVGLDLDTGESVKPQGPTPWPKEVFEDRPDAIKVKNPRMAALLERFLDASKVELRRTAHTLFESWQARAFSRLKPEWLDPLPEEPSRSFLSPTGKWLFYVCVLRHPPSPDKAEDESPEYSPIFMLDTHTGSIISKMELAESNVTILFRGK